MDVKMLDMKKHVDIESGCLCRYVKSDTEYFRPHYHNYYELFLVIKGEVCHIINNREQRLSKGHLVFIRDFDIHDYKSADGNHFELVNLAFTKDNLEALFEYLGESFPAKELLSMPNPPTVILSERDVQKLLFSITALNDSIPKEIIKVKMRSLIMNIFMQYFFDYSDTKTDIPLWLEMTYEKMKKSENFIYGVEKMYEICPKSREHLCRCLKKYYNLSPTELVNNLRLEHCVNLLLTSNLSVTDICFECGFENVSWFYKVFIKKFGTTPAEYRKKYDIKQ